MRSGHNLGLTGENIQHVAVLCVARKENDQYTVNLRSPLIINTVEGRFQQVILQNEAYGIEAAFPMDKNGRRDEEEIPNLSVCMIVKDEEKNLPRLLASIKGLADEVIVVDTGSKDDTVRIAKEASAQRSTISPGATTSPRQGTNRSNTRQRISSSGSTGTTS